MKQFIHLNLDEPHASSTALRHTEDGEAVIKTTIADNVRISADPGEMALQLGRSVRRYVRTGRTDDGQVTISIRIAQPSATPPIVPETICATDHGRLYRTSRKTRLVFEFPLHASFNQISDALDDECYELREFLDHTDD